MNNCKRSEFGRVLAYPVVYKHAQMNSTHERFNAIRVMHAKGFFKSRV